MISRYYNKPTGNTWSLSSTLKRWKDIEIAHLIALSNHDIIPKKDLHDITDNIKVNEERFLEIEKESKHDLQAFVQMLEESIPNNSGRWLHFGLTSSDIVDTSSSLACKETLQHVINELSQVINTLSSLNSKYYQNNILGRTHGVVAEAQTLGDVFNRWLNQARRAHDNIVSAKATISVGKLSGPVGNNSTNNKYHEFEALKSLGLKPMSSSQIIPRDVYLDYFYSMLKAVLFVEKVAYDIRHYSQEFIEEMAEGFSKNQKGSSSMPHKRNPILSENLCGLSRLYKGYMQVAIDNCLSLFERDISHSAPERVIFEDCGHLATFSLSRLNNVLQNLTIKENNIQKNFELKKHKFDSQREMNELIMSGMSRIDALHEIRSKFS